MRIILVDKFFKKYWKMVWWEGGQSWDIGNWLCQIYTTELKISFFKNYYNCVLLIVSSSVRCHVVNYHWTIIITLSTMNVLGHLIIFVFIKNLQVLWSSLTWYSMRKDPFLMEPYEDWSSLTSDLMAKVKNIQFENLSLSPFNKTQFWFMVNWIVHNLLILITFNCLLLIWSCSLSSYEKIVHVRYYKRHLGVIFEILYPLGLYIKRR